MSLKIADRYSKMEQLHEALTVEPDIADRDTVNTHPLTSTQEKEVRKLNSPFHTEPDPNAPANHDTVKNLSANDRHLSQNNTDNHVKLRQSDRMPDTARKRTWALSAVLLCAVLVFLGVNDFLPYWPEALSLTEKTLNKSVPSGQEEETDPDRLNREAYVTSDGSQSTDSVSGNSSQSSQSVSSDDSRDADSAAGNDSMTAGDTVSIGDSILTMINLTGYTLEDATDVLNRMDPSIRIQTTDAYSKAYASGRVISQSISDHTQFTRGRIENITLTISKGAAPSAQTGSSAGTGNRNQGSTKQDYKVKGIKEKGDGYTTLHLD